MAKNDKHQAAVSSAPIMPNIPGVNLEGFEDEQVGLPPYWRPNEEALDQGVGQGFLASVVSFDDGDPDFHRYVMQATHDMQCFRGPSDTAEEVAIKKGDFFSISDYHGLPLGRYIGMNPIYVFAKEKIGIKGGHTLWVWGVKVDKETKALLSQSRTPHVVGNGKPAAQLPAQS